MRDMSIWRDGAGVPSGACVDVPHRHPFKQTLLRHFGVNGTHGFGARQGHVRFTDLGCGRAGPTRRATIGLHWPKVAIQSLAADALIAATVSVRRQKCRRFRPRLNRYYQPLEDVAAARQAAPSRHTESFRSQFPIASLESASLGLCKDEPPHLTPEGTDRAPGAVRRVNGGVPPCPTSVDARYLG